MRPSHWLGSVLRVSFTALTLKLVPLISKVLFRDKYWKKTDAKLAEPGSPGKQHNRSTIVLNGFFEDFLIKINN